MVGCFDCLGFGFRAVIVVFLYFLVSLCSMQYLSSLTRNWICAPFQGKRCVLTTGWPGKSRHSVLNYLILPIFCNRKGFVCCLYHFWKLRLWRQLPSLSFSGSKHIISYPHPKHSDSSSQHWGSLLYSKPGSRAGAAAHSTGQRRPGGGQPTAGTQYTV